MRMLNTRAGDIFGHRLHFDAFSTIHTETIDMRSRFDPLSRAFSNRCVSDENAQRNSVDRRPKRIEISAFSKENQQPISQSELLPCNGVFTYQFVFRTNFAANFDYKIILGNHSAKIVFLMFGYHLLFLFVIIVVWMCTHTERRFYLRKKNTPKSC